MNRWRRFAQTVTRPRPWWWYVLEPFLCYAFLVNVILLTMIVMDPGILIHEGFWGMLRALGRWQLSMLFLSSAGHGVWVLGLAILITIVLFLMVTASRVASRARRRAQESPT